MRCIQLARNVPNWEHYELPLGRLPKKFRPGNELRELFRRTDITRGYVDVVSYLGMNRTAGEISVTPTHLSTIPLSESQSRCRTEPLLPDENESVYNYRLAKCWRNVGAWSDQLLTIRVLDERSSHFAGSWWSKARQ